MNILPKTVGGVSIYMFITFVMVLILFLDNYKWVNVSKYLSKK
jgi:hypothetical protein